MKAYLIQDAIGNISDKLIIDAEIAWQRKMRRTPRAIFLLAACLVISLSLMLTVFNRINDPPTDKPNTTPPGSDHSGIVPPEDNTIPDTPIDPDSLSKVLEVGYDSAAVSGLSSPIKVAYKIDRIGDLTQDKIPVTISYGFYGSQEDLIKHIETVPATHVQVYFVAGTNNGEVKQILKEMTVEEYLKGGYEIEPIYKYFEDGSREVSEYKFAKEERYYLDCEILRDIKDDCISPATNVGFVVLFYNKKGDENINIDIEDMSLGGGATIYVRLEKDKINFYTRKEFYEIFGYL